MSNGYIPKPGGHFRMAKLYKMPPLTELQGAGVLRSNSVQKSSRQSFTDGEGLISTFSPVDSLR